MTASITNSFDTASLENGAKTVDGAQVCTRPDLASAAFVHLLLGTVVAGAVAIKVVRGPISSPSPASPEPTLCSTKAPRAIVTSQALQSWACRLLERRAAEV